MSKRPLAPSDYRSKFSNASTSRQINAALENVGRDLARADEVIE
jgi:hypothetical protein